MARRLQNIIIKAKGESLRYIPVNGGGGELNIPNRKSRKQHALNLQAQLNKAWSSALDETKKFKAKSSRDGVYLLIEGKEDDYERLICICSWNRSCDCCNIIC